VRSNSRNAKTLQKIVLPALIVLQGNREFELKFELSKTQIPTRFLQNPFFNATNSRDMKVQVYDYRWQDENTCTFEGAGREGIYMQKFGKKPLRLGENISLEVCSDVRCAGVIENNIWKPCPKNSLGKPQCEYCRAIAGNFVFTAFDGFDQSSLNEGDLDKISGEHVVYIALFSKNLIKIGVSKKERKTMRQIEQGSWATLFIAQTPDGISARQIESLIRQAGMQDKIKASQKLGSLVPDITTKEAESFLREISKAHISAMDSHQHLKSFLFPTAEFIGWEDVYGFHSLKKAPVTISLSEIGDWVSGKIVAWKGSFLVIDTGEGVHALNAKTLRGREIEFDPKPRGFETQAVLQNTLF
jgi:hypothetical protein